MAVNVNEGQEMYDFICKIFPYCRSLTGEGVRQTLNDLREFITQGGGPELQVFEVPSGTKAFDWTVPREWKIREAYIEDEAGNHIIDMKDNNLHVLGYSTPVDKWVSLDELKEHIYTQPDQPDCIPYVTSYYKERFGFCMSENMKNSLPEGKYHMYIDSELFDGVLNYAEIVIPGETDEEVFFSTYFCHPSMANNECSGPALSGELVKYVISLPLLALGYYNDLDRTNKSFINNPNTQSYNETIYRTGDYGRWREDGLLEYHGRVDRQIKYMGHRVELDEVELTAMELQGIDECLVFFDEEKERICMAYKGIMQKKDLIIHFREKLPAYMVPRKIKQIDEIPKLPNGKNDVQELRRNFL